MANSYTNVGTILQVDGENDTTWGDYTNLNMSIYALLAGGASSQTITTTDVTPPNVNGTADAGKSLIFVCSGALTGNRKLILPTVTRPYIVTNNCTGAFTLTATTVAGTGVVVPQNGSLLLYCDGTNIINAVNTTGLGVVLSNVATLFTAQQNFQTYTLTDATNIAWNLSVAQVAKVILGGNRTLSNPTNMVDGGTYILRVTQDGTGTRTLSYGINYDFGSAGTPILSTASGALDILTFVCDGSKMYGSIQKGF